MSVTKGDIKITESSEDIALKETIHGYVKSIENNTDCLDDLNNLRKLIITSTTSMTSVPKPLKFLKEHYEFLRSMYEKVGNDSVKCKLADIISVVGIVVFDKEEYATDTLNFRFKGCHEDIETWGHEYVRHLTNQIVSMWQVKDLANDSTNEGLEISENSENLKCRCLALVHKIIPYFMKHNAETEAVDLAVELEILDIVSRFCEKNNYDRVCLYMTKTVMYLADPENKKLLTAAAKIYEHFGDIGNALKCALKLNNADYAERLVVKTKDEAIQKQMAFLLARQQYKIPFDALADGNSEKLVDIVSNTRLSEYFHILGRELDIMDPKVPEDIYKTHLEPTRPSLGSSNIDSAKNNLASSYVNGLVNCGFGKDKLVMGEDSKWLYRNKDIGMTSTVGTLGWLLLWDVDEGLSQIDRYLYSDDDYIRAGGLLACGIVNSGVKNECDPALAILSDYVGHTKTVFSRASIIGLGVAYAGTNKPEVLEMLQPIIRDTGEGDKFELACLAALSSGLIAVSSMDADLTTTILETLMERPVKQWSHPFSKFMALGLGLTVLGKQDEAEIVLASLTALPEPMRALSHLMCEILAYAGSGSVLKVQKLLHILSEKAVSEEKKEDPVDTKAKTATEAPAEEEATAMDVDGSNDEIQFDYLPHQGLAALGVGLISMGEPIGQEMGFRALGHLLRFGENSIKRAVPLALALMWASDPQMRVLDTLGKFSHDADQELAFCAIMSMGVVGAGTNNARLAAMLRQLASFHAKEPQCLLAVRLAQGLLHLGKGTLTLSPHHQDRFLVSPVAVAALTCLLVSCLDVKKTFTNKNDMMLFYLTPAIQPRLLITFDEQLNPVPVSVRVGQAVDTVGQAGRPKTITGFQTHTTPVLLAAGERAELSSEEYLPVSQLPLEGFCILRKNPDFEH